tara:strand:+ start:19248 stop:19772 length:525 start_codon:yes stop_codon:yes gene_type:complete
MQSYAITICDSTAPSAYYVCFVILLPNGKTITRTAVSAHSAIVYAQHNFKFIIMENILFYAKMAKAGAKVGKAVKLESVSDNKELSDIIIRYSYWPLSQLRADVINMNYNDNYALVECRVPHWLWDSKLEDADSDFKANISDSFTQLTLMMDTDNITLPPKKEKIRDIMNEGLE